MGRAQWDDLPDDVRLQLDELIGKDRKIHAVKLLRESLPEPRPGLYECMDLIAERTRALGLRFAPDPTPPLDPDAIEREIQALPWPAAAIEAQWDGDSFGWMVCLSVVAAQPGTEHCLKVIRHGTDMRLFNGEAPPWTEAVEVTRIGRLLAARFGIPFYFASPEQPEIDQPRWWDPATGLPPASLIPAVASRALG